MTVMTAFSNTLLRKIHGYAEVSEKTVITVMLS